MHNNIISISEKYRIEEISVDDIDLDNLYLYAYYKGKIKYYLLKHTNGKVVKHKEMIYLPIEDIKEYFSTITNLELLIKL